MELTFKRQLAIFWAIGWRSALLSVIAGAVIGAVVTYVALMAGVPQEGQVVSLVLSSLAGLWISWWAFRVGLTKRYGDFRLVLEPLPPA